MKLLSITMMVKTAAIADDDDASFQQGLILNALLAPGGDGYL